MSSLQIPFQCSSSSSSQKRVQTNAVINLPKLPRVRISLPKIPSSSTKLVHEFNGSIQKIVPSQKDVMITTSQAFQDCSDTKKSKAIVQLHAILVAVSERVEMHKNIGEQRNNWNSILLNSINIIILHLSMTIHNTAFKSTSILLLTVAKGMLLIMNKIQTSKRNATSSFKNLQADIQTTLTHAKPTEEDIDGAMERILALDKAYPLPLSGTKLEKLPSKFEPRINDAYQMKVFKTHKNMNNNGWSPELEKEMREILEVVKRKDREGCERRGNLAVKINKIFAIVGPLLVGIAAIGSALERHGSSWAGVVAVMAGSLADFINALQGVVIETCKNCGGFLQNTIEATLEEKDYEKRENGQRFEMNVARKLGRSVSQLRKLASKLAAYDSEGVDIDEESASELL